MVKRPSVRTFLACATMLIAAVFLMVRCRIVVPRNIGGSHKQADKVYVDGRGGQVLEKSQPEIGQVTLLRKAFRDGDCQMVNSVVRMLAGRDMEKALAVLLEMKPGWKLVRAFLSAWADIDPATCARWVVENLPKGGDRSFIMQHVIGQWVEKDVQKAFAWAQSLSVEQGRDSALQALFEKWAGIDPKSSAKALALLKDFPSCNLAKGAIAWHWARKDIDAATAWAWNLPKDSGYTYALYNIAMVLRETDDKARSSEWAKSFPVGYTNNQVLKRIASFLAGSDSGKTVAMLTENMPGGFGNMPDLQLFLVRWAKKDPEAAKIWAYQLADGRGRENALYAIAQVVESGNKSTAGNVVEGSVSAPAVSDGQTADGEKSGKISVSEILNQDLSVAISLAEQLPDGAERDAVMHSVALRWAEDDPAGAAAWVVQQMPEGRELNVTLRTIIWSWSEKDSAGALSWVNQMTDEGKQIESRATVAMALARTNPLAAADVVAQIPCGETRNNVVSNIAFQWAHTDRSAAATWAQTLTVEQGKEHALAAISRAVSN